MKRFLRYVFGILGATLILFGMINVIYYKWFNHSRLVAYEVYEALDVTKQKTEYTAVVLGDSVARQFFNPEYQDEDNNVCYLATNQAIMAAGNYILLESFLQSNPQVEEVHYVVRPDSLMSSPNFTYTYSYFITPFFEDNYLKYLDEETVAGIEECYGKIWTHNHFMKWLLAKYPKGLEMYNNTCKRLSSYKYDRIKSDLMPDTSLPYLKKMKEICDDQGISFYLLSVPVTEGYVCDFKTLQTGMQELEMQDLYEQLVTSMEYVDPSEFVDGIHLKKEYILTNRDTYRKLLHKKDERRKNVK